MSPVLVAPRLSDGQVTHDVHIQTIDVAKPVFEAGRNTEVNFKDTYRYNIAGYRRRPADRPHDGADVGRA